MNSGALHNEKRFHSNCFSQEDAYNRSHIVNLEIEKEGFVLLKNEGNILPLKEGSKISLFGRAGFDEAGIKMSIKNAGFELNEALCSFYESQPLMRRGGCARSPGFRTGELAVSCYTDDVKKSFSEYHDAAIVIISRYASEGADIPRTALYDKEKDAYGVWYDTEKGICADDKLPAARYGTDHALQLDQNEADLLKMCGDCFDDVIVILNVGTKFECGFLDDPNHYGYHKNLKAAIWIGKPAKNLLNPLGEILSGKVNPSGRTVDIWSRDFKEDPTWMNFGVNLKCDSFETKGNNYANAPDPHGSADVSNNDYKNMRNYYVIYKEGIYFGYHYYETRGYEEGDEKWSGTGVYTENASADGNGPIHGTSTTEWDNWYQAHVVYPFGYGLSYTTFTQEVIKTSGFSKQSIEKDDTVTVWVKVTNTGNVAGKEVVQLYYTAPYYKGEIEKSHIVLGDYCKTKLLRPGESEIVRVGIKVTDMASYDYNDANGNGFRGYELEKGIYSIKLMKNSHECIFSVDYKVNETLLLRLDAITGYEVVNRFDDTSCFLTNAADDAKQPGLGEKYLSRSDFNGTYPTTAYRIFAPQWVFDEARPLRDTPDTPEQPYYNNTMPVTGAENGIDFKQLTGKAYDDPMWEPFLDQLNVRQMKLLTLFGGYHIGIDTKYHPGLQYHENDFVYDGKIDEERSKSEYIKTQAALSEIEKMGIMSTPSFDGPWGFSTKPIWTDRFGNPKLYNTYVGNIILAATFNNDLAFFKGEAIGNEALWAGIGSWYAPACNLHRSPFGGRNNEYFSEDPFLSGMMSAAIVQGAQGRGLLTFVKHFVLNEQERDRHVVMTWANEQCMRQQYFKPFEISVKHGRAHGMMISMNRVGAVFSGDSYALLQEVLRNEWGFEGVVVTDSCFVDNVVNHMIRCGVDLILCFGGALYPMADTATGVNALRKATKNVLYALSTSSAMEASVSLLREIRQHKVDEAVVITAEKTTKTKRQMVDPICFTECRIYQLCKDYNKVVTIGRTEMAENGITCDFSASGISFTALARDRICVQIDVDRDTYFTVYVDGKRDAKRYKLTPTECKMIIETENEPAEHEIKILKQGEIGQSRAVIGNVQLNGILLEPKALLKRYIEFIGDEIACGYGLMATDGSADLNSAECTDATQAYAFLTAERLKADFSLVCCGGIGMAIEKEKQVLPFNITDFYPYTSYLRSNTKKYNATCIPDCVVIGLGTNDYIKETPKELFKEAVHALIAMIRETYGEVKIVWAYNMMGECRAEWVKEAFEEWCLINCIDADKLVMIELPKGSAGVGAYPDGRDQQRAAEKLSSYIMKNIFDK